MALANYTDLKASIADTLNRADLTAVIPDWIALCEAEINRTIRWRKMLVRDTTTIDEEVEDLPTDFLESKSLCFLTNPKVVPVPASFEAVRHAQILNESRTGTPTMFCIVGTKIMFDRVAAGLPTLEHWLYVRIPALASVATNQLLTECPDLYLYGSLIHSAPYLKDDPRVELWVQLYGAALKSLSDADERAERPAGMSQRSMPRRAIG